MMLLKIYEIFCNPWIVLIWLWTLLNIEIFMAADAISNVGSMRFTLPSAPSPGRALCGSAMDTNLGVMKIYGGKYDLL